MKDSKAIPLFEIAKCDLRDRHKSKYWIPNIQRGLVWKTIQMELLWDSILRGFPIGAMLVLERGQGRGEILDGQQRSNAIIAGSNIYNLLNNSHRPNTIIWLDLAFKPSEYDDERRRFGISVTNSSHPWGFDANGATLSAQQRRDSIKLAYNQQPPKNKSEWDIRRFIPYYFYKQKGKDFIPIPIAILVDASERTFQNGTNNFWEIVRESVKAFAEFAPFWKENYLDTIYDFIDTQKSNESIFMNVFLELKNYKVVFNYIEQDDDIELLFNRVNRRGTPTKPIELTYAAIKHYGEIICNEPELGIKISKNADGLMMEHILSQIILRYCFSDDNIHGNIDATQVRALAFSNKNVKNNQIIHNLTGFFENDKLSNTLKKVKEILLTPWDGGCDLPNYLIAEIADKKPELIILIFCILDHPGDLLDNNNYSFVQALVFYLYCFSNSNNTTMAIFEFLKKTSFNTGYRENILNILRDAISRGWCMPLVASFDNFPALDESLFDNNWNIEKFGDSKGYSLFRLLFEYKKIEGCFMLKYSLKDFYTKIFSDYNPSLREYWEDINCPWDHDHIIPRNWIQEGDWKEVLSYWINSMGNIADIPYEENRSKSDSSDFHYYSENNQELLFDDQFCEINPQQLGQGVDAIKFMRLAKKRFLSISNMFLSRFNSLDIEGTLSPLQKQRKDFIDYLQNKYDNGLFNNFQLFFRGENGSIIEFVFDGSYCWQRPCVLLIQNEENKPKHAISVSFNDYNTSDFRIEYGVINMENSTWEEGSMLARNTALYVNGEISPLAEMLINGARIMTKKYGLDGFETNSKSILTYNTKIDNTGIEAYIYTYYGCCYCKIKTVKNENLPQIILDKFNVEMGFNWRCDTSIDCRLSDKNYDIRKVCDDFAKKMLLLNQLTVIV